MSFIDEISANFDGHLTRIELPESAAAWGWPAVVYAKPFTMGDRKKVQKFIDVDQAEGYVRIVCNKLCDEDGNRLLEDGDKFRLAKKSPAWLVALIGDAIVASQSTPEAEAEK